jgi:hypothetical protein
MGFMPEEACEALRAVAVHGGSEAEQASNGRHCHFDSN